MSCNSHTAPLMALILAVLLTAQSSAARSLADVVVKRASAIPEPMIIGGSVVRDNRYPYAAIIFDKERGYCSGALIHPQVVISAGHCSESDYVGAKIGTRNWLLDDIYGRIYYAKTISKVIQHPDYKKNNKRIYNDMVGDLALYVLSSPTADDATVIQLPSPDLKIPLKLDTVGYGTTYEGGENMSVLRTVSLTSVERKTCNKLLNKINPSSYNLTDAVICAGVLKGGKDTCQGDSGGPLMIKGATASQDILVGLTSFGEGCGRKNAPAGYTNLKLYTPWIKKELDKLAASGVIKAVPQKKSASRKQNIHPL